MADHHSIPVGGGRRVRVVFTDSADGDFRVVDPAPGLDRRRRAVVDRPWSWLVQVHGATVHEVDRAGQHAGAEGDGLVTTESGCPVSVTTADCAPVVLVADSGLAVVHAGWRGLLAGIVEGAAVRLREHGGGRPVATLLGPCIAPRSYQFGADDLASVADRYGPEVVGRTAAGDPALDVPAAVAAACRAAGWPVPTRPPCTSDRRWYSHRLRADRARQAAVAWLQADDDPDHRGDDGSGLRGDDGGGVRGG
jgi:copper oxidase (laccase) domain-containing protein